MKSVNLSFGHNRPGQRRLLYVLFGLLLVLQAGCGGSKDKVKNEEARPGRDRELYEDAAKKLDKGRYDESRLLFNVVITTYPDSEWLPMAKLAIADSFYLEGGSTALEQAIGGYKDFAQYFPTHPKTCEVKLKIAEAYMRQMNAYNRDWTKAQQAEFQLKATKQSCTGSPLLPEVDERLKQVQQIEGLHEIDIADFYFGNRRAYNASAERYKGIIEKYPFFTYRDKALFRLALSMLEQEQPEEASQYLTTLVRDIPGSEYVKEASEYLQKLGKPIPAPAAEAAAPEHYGRAGRFALMIGRNGLTIDRDGILFKKSGKEEEQTAESLQRPSSLEGSSEIRATTASSVQPVVNSTAGAAPAASTAQPRSASATSATDGASKPVEKKNDKKEEKKKKGFMGRIFK
ncbi:MAG: outer membrane protein assembly factor BamD [Blastocatellia bacterium]